MHIYSSLLKLKPGKRLLQTLLLLLAVFLFSALSIFISFVLKNLDPSEYGLIRGNKDDFEVTYKEIMFFVSIVLAFLVLSISFRHVSNRRLRLFLISLSLFYLLAAFLMVLTDVIYYLIFAYRITFSSVQTVLNSDAEEAKGFVKLYYSHSRLLVILLFIAAGFFIASRRRWFAALFATRSFFITSLLISAFGVIDFIQLAHSKGNGTHNMRYWDITIGEYNEYHAFNRKLASEKNTLNLSKEYDGFYKQDTLQKTIVLVLSESLSKRHMSLYGYQRRTTPNLDTNTSIFKFNDCVTLAPLTIEAVPGLFVNGYLSNKINLIALLNKLGYETAWISNQSGWGKQDGPIVLLSQVCKETVFLDALADDEKSNASLHYDENILARFDQALAAPSRSSRLIVLHFMGCHFDYEKRYPAGRSYFTSAPPAKLAVSSALTHSIVNFYDNAVHYHDSVINEVLKVFTKRSTDKNAALLFLADHGEELYEHRNYAGHGYPPSRVTSEIPAFAFLSPGFKKNYPATEEAMKARKNTPYSTANNFYTVLQLLNISSKKHRNKILKNAFFSPYYDSTANRQVMGVNYSEMH